MAYTINKFNGSFLVTVQDGTVDTSTDLNLVGKNYAGYGAIENENLVYLLENFSNTSPPPKALTGQIWYDSGNKKLKYYDGSKFKVAGGAETGSSAPSGLATGEFWFDTSAKQLYTWSGTEYVLIGPQASPELGTSSVTSQVVKDDTNANQTILKIIAGGKVMAVVSESEFVLNNVNPITGFSLIKKGITLVNTNSNGITTTGTAYFWGTASNAVSLGGVEATEYIRKGSITFDQDVTFQNAGYYVGNSKDLYVHIGTNVQGNTSSLLESINNGNPVTIRINYNNSAEDVAIFDNTGMIPGADNAYTIGNTGYRWSDVYATTFHGNLTGNVTGNSTGTHTGTVAAVDATILVNGSTKEIGYTGATIRGNLVGTVSGNVTGTATNATTLTNFVPSTSLPSSIDKTSIPVRNSSGNIIANQFVGTADKADRIKIDDTAIDSDPNYKTAKTTATGSTIAARTSGGNLVAVLFDGTATAARYADLAEKYLPDQEYAPGTVVTIGGDAEITQASGGDRAIGVISTNPAYMMNKDLEGGVYVALKGRVPCRVLGPVSKGDDMCPGPNGVAVSDRFGDKKVFGVALESSDDEGEKIIEVLVL